MTPAQAELADRIRAYLPPVPDEKSMFGVWAFMVDGKLTACASTDGSMLLRVDPDEHDVLAQRPGAETAKIGPKRNTMGAGWLVIESEALASDDELLFWLDRALEFNAVLTDPTQRPR